MSAMYEESQQAPIAPSMIGEQSASIARKINYFESSDALTPLASFTRTARVTLPNNMRENGRLHISFIRRARHWPTMQWQPCETPSLARFRFACQRSLISFRLTIAMLIRSIVLLPISFVSAPTSFSCSLLFLRVQRNAIQKCRGSVADVKGNKRPNDKSDNNRCIDFRTWPC